MIGDRLEQYTYKYLMSWALSYVDDSLDKREGSIIYDALAPFCQVLAGFFMELRGFYQDTFAVTATGEALDNRAAEQGITRYPATYAIKLGYFADGEGTPMAVPMGARFSTVSETSPINYTVVDYYYGDNGLYVPGYYQLRCEKPGTVGNQYSGNLVNITFIQGMATAELTTLLHPARDEETDEELRTRYFAALNQKAFGGNIADYREKVMALDGVSAVQVYPTWNGGGTVKISIVDPEYNPVSEEYIAEVQELIDPENSQGETGDGLGIAPIGHQVTVVTPEEVDVAVSATLVLRPGYAVGQVQGPIQTALEKYIEELRKSWAQSNDMNEYSMSMFIARVTSAIINVPGVANVTGVTLNGEAEDITFQENAQTQQLPSLGEVTVSV